MAISIFVSCLGIFTLSSLILVMRAREMSIRKVVGASHYEVLQLHLKSFGKFLFISAGVSWPMIYLLSENWLNNFAYHIDVSVWNFILPTAGTFLIVMLISAYHGFKSAMVNPVDILKHE
jgi:putative ABC transport system permease protein